MYGKLYVCLPSLSPSPQLPSYNCFCLAPLCKLQHVLISEPYAPLASGPHDSQGGMWPMEASWGARREVPCPLCTPETEGLGWHQTGKWKSNPDAALIRQKPSLYSLLCDMELDADNLSSPLHATPSISSPCIAHLCFS